jgi:hypothetical protein
LLLLPLAAELLSFESAASEAFSEVAPFGAGVVDGVDEVDGDGFGVDDISEQPASQKPRLTPIRAGRQFFKMAEKVMG